MHWPFCHNYNHDEIKFDANNSFRYPSNISWYKQLEYSKQRKFAENEIN